MARTISIPRLHLFEVEDQPWCPPLVRNFATDYLRGIEGGFGLYEPIARFLAKALRSTETRRVIDLCSGGGGPVPAIQKALASQDIQVHFTFTDQFPNLRTLEWLTVGARDLAFVATPVDARAVPPDLVGLRTLFNAFHHFRPSDAVAVLRDAVNQRQPIAIFEFVERRVHRIFSMLLLTPLLVALITPFIRPFSWSRLLWTYILPLVPLLCWWDGIVSHLRAYTVAELSGLARAAGSDRFTWRAGRLPHASIPGGVTFLLGQPHDRKVARKKRRASRLVPAC